MIGDKTSISDRQTSQKEKSRNSHKKKLIYNKICLTQAKTWQRKFLNVKRSRYNPRAKV